LYVEPDLLPFGEEEVAQLLFLDLIEIVDDYANEEVQNELRANDHESDEENDHILSVVAFRLLARCFGVDS